MCTIIVAIDHFAAAPVAIAANRDEAYARPTSPGTRLEPEIVGGLDRLAGGTWMGMHRSGFVVGLTNLGPTASGRLSRGQLVVEAIIAVSE